MRLDALSFADVETRALAALEKMAGGPQANDAQMIGELVKRMDNTLRANAATIHALERA